MAHAIKEKIFNIMRANNFTGIFHTLLELEFKFPLYQQVSSTRFLLPGQPLQDAVFFSQ